MQRAERPRAGVALLEVLLAVALLGTAGLAMVGLALDAGRAVSRAAVSERDMTDADDFMMHVALWDQLDLDRRLGERRQGPWRLDVSRPAPSLYDVTLRDSTGAHILLATTLYRPRIGGGEAAR